MIFLIYRHESDEKTFNFIYSQDLNLNKRNIVNESSAKLEYKFQYFDSNLNLSEISNWMRKDNRKLSKSFSKTSFIYYSNVFDLTKLDYPGVEKLATNFLIYEDKEKHLNSNIADRSITELEAHKIRELERQISFSIQFLNGSSSEFTLPEYVIIKGDNSNRKYLNNLFYEEKTDDHFRKNIQQLLLSIDETEQYLRKKETPLEQKKFEIQKSYLVNLFRYFIDNRPQSTIKAEPIILVFLQTVRLQLENHSLDFNIIKRKTIESEKEAEEKNGFINDLLSNQLARYIEFENILNSLLNSDSIRFSRFLCPTNKKELTDIIKAYKKALNITGFLEFEWRDLSSGEIGYLTFFSRFYSLLTENLSNNILENDLIILIDEGELYFHPRWQRKLVYWVNEILPQTFKGQRIQIFISSHSPFIVSDLPKENVLFLKKEFDEVKEDKGKCVVSDLSNHEKTFGANIHTLYTDAFFMDDQFIGDFAKSKIERAVSLIDQSVLTDDELKEIKSIIEIIGEPVIQERLEFLLASSHKVESKDQVIEELRRQNQQLKKMLDEKDSNN